MQQKDRIKLTKHIEEVYFGDYIADLIEGDRIQQSKLLWKYIWSYDPRTKKDSADGKWVIHHHQDELRRIAEEILFPFLENKNLTLLKYRPMPNDPDGPWRHLQPPLCVYDLDTNKHKSQELLLSLGFTDIYWQSEQATRKRRV